MADKAHAANREQIRVAAPHRQRIAPAFTVKRLEGTVKREIFSFDEKGKRQAQIVDEPRGYRVTFSKGHSIRVRTDADMKRLKFDQTIPLVDDNDDVHGYMPNDIFERNNNEIINIDGEE